MRNVLRIMRVGAGISQHRLADMTGMTQNMVSRIERGTREPDHKQKRAIAKALCTPEAILFPPSDQSPR